MKKLKISEIEKIKAESWKEGFESGMKAVQRESGREIRIGRAIMDVMFETFETQKEDY